MVRTFYQVLGVGEAASDAEITAAYRRKVKETHPDLSDRAEAREDFQRVVRAEEVLSNPDERARYDRLGHEAYLAERAGLGGPGSDRPPWADTQPGRDGGADGSAEGADPGGPTGPGGPGFDWEDVWGPAGTTAGRHPGAEGGGRAGGVGQAGHERGASTGAGGTTSATGANNATGTNDATGTNSATGSGSAWTADTVWDAAQRQAAWHKRRAAARDRYGPEHWAGSPYDRSAYINGSQVHWDEERVGQFIETQESLLLFVVMLFLYPIFLFSSVTSQFPVAVNALVALCTAGTVVYMLTRPRVALPFFGSFSVIAPLGLVATGVSFTSLTGLYVLGVTWIPFVYAGLIGWMLVR